MTPAVLEFLRRSGLAGADEVPQAFPLGGGVSSDIWRIDLARGPVCVKRALPRLKVAALWEAPVERNRFERRWMVSVCAIAPQAVPAIHAHDDEAGLFAMEWLDLPLWKTRLREGDADAQFAAQVGATLGAIHSATAGNPALASEFATDASFHALRLEPYLVATAGRHPDLRDSLHQLADRTARSRHCLVHGDVSPKNILIGPRGPIFLDAECAWYGDPAFDLAFCLNHLLLKGVWVPHARARFLECFDALSRAYLARVAFEGVEARTAALLPGLLLARVDGKSPVEYLTDEKQKDGVRAFARRYLKTPPAALGEIRDAWQGSST